MSIANIAPAVGRGLPDDVRLIETVIRHETVFRLPNDRALIPRVIQYLQDIALQLRAIEDSDQLPVGVALEEALLNAMVHGNLEVSSDLREQDNDTYERLIDLRCRQLRYVDRRVTVEARLKKGFAAYRIQDDGPGFNPAAIPDPTVPNNMARPHGRGLLLIRNFMDEVQFNSAGNCITMIKRRTGIDESAGRDPGTPAFSP